jgi:hypothetical protein
MTFRCGAEPTTKYESKVVDFMREVQRLGERRRSLALHDNALGMCEEMFILRDWKGFAYWYAIFQRERRRLRTR